MKSPSGWSIENGQLTRVFEFKNFSEAIGFANKILPVAEEARHHPDLEIFSYNKVRVKLITHSSGKITEKDIALAERINRVFL